MTDAELIELVSRAEVEDLTMAELSALRQRLPHSPELRQAVKERADLETHLNAAFGGIDLSVDRILLRAADRKAEQTARRQKALWWALGLSVCLLLVAVGVLFTQRRPGPEPIAAKDPAVADKTKSAEPKTTPSVPAAKTDDGKPAVAATEPSPEMAAEPMTPAPAAPPKAEPSNEPWAALEAADYQPVSYQSRPFLSEFRTAGLDEIGEATFRQWFAAVPGNGFDVGQDRMNQKQTVRFNGVAKLRAPWHADSALRFAPFDVNFLTIYCWNKGEGVAFRYYQHRQPQTWYAYRVYREGAEPRPKRWELITSDGAAWARSGQGMIDLVASPGRLQLVRGRLPLLSAPIAEVPDEVYLEGQFRLRGMSYQRVAEVPEPVVATRPSEPITPSDALWKIPRGEVGETAFEDGSVWLRGNSPHRQALAAREAPVTGLVDVAFQLTDPSPGTAFYLGDDRGRPLVKVAILRERRSKQLVATLLHPHAQHDEMDADLQHQPIGFWSPGLWLRVTGSSGYWQLWTSPDGEVWGHAPEAAFREWVPGRIATVGLSCAPGQKPRETTLRSLVIRRPDAFSKLFRRDVLDLTPDWADDETQQPVRFAQKAISTCPADVPLDEWVRACTYSVLRQGAVRELAQPLLRDFVQDLPKADLPPEVALAGLQDVVPLLDAWDEITAKLIVDSYRRIAARLIDRDPIEGVATLRRAFVTTPLWTYHQLGQSLAPAEQQALVASVYRDAPEKAEGLAQQLLFWYEPAHPDQRPQGAADSLFKQADWTRRRLGEATGHADAGVVPRAWQQPLFQQLSKEGYNVSAELQASLAGEAWSDGSRVIAGMVAADSNDLLPAMNDPQLFVSLRTAIGAAMAAYPQLQKHLLDELGSLGEVRVRQSIADADAPAVEAATLQFFGTPAAALAHRWLADRAVADGRFLTAAVHLEAAFPHAGADEAGDFVARRQVIARLLGESAESPASVPAVSLGSYRGSADEWKSLLESIPAKAAPASASAATATHQEWEATPFSLFDPTPGQHANRGEYKAVDVPGRHLGVAQDGERLFLHNHFQVSAYNLADGRPLWSHSAGGDQGDAHHFAFVRMQPVLGEGRLFARIVLKDSTELVALQPNDGNLAWRYKPATNGHVVTDPWVQGRELAVVVALPGESEIASLEWHVLELSSGRLLRSEPLFRLRTADGRVPCAGRLVGRQLAFTAPGVTALVNEDGRLAWVRQHLWVPSPVDDQRYDGRVEPPVSVGEKIITVPAGVRVVTALDRATGKTLWESPVPDLQGVAEVSTDGLILARSTDRWTALEADTGNLRWTFHSPDLLEGWLATPTELMVTRRVVWKERQGQVETLWLDLASGRPVAKGLVRTVEGNELAAGPIIRTPQGLKMLASGERHQPKRELLNLKAANPGTSLALGEPTDLSIFEPWFAETANVPGVRLGTFRPLQTSQSRLEGRRELPDGKGPAVVSKIGGRERFLWQATARLGENEAAKLRLRVAHPNDQKWRLVVRGNDRLLLDRLIGEEVTSEFWKDIEIDLAPFRGRTVNLVVTHHSPGNAGTEAFWQRLEIVPATSEATAGR